MLVLEDALVLDPEGVVEHRRGEALAPDFPFQQASRFQVVEAVLQRAVGFEAAGQVGGVDQTPHHALEQSLEAAQIVFADGQSGRHGVAPELEDQRRRLLGHQIKRVPQVQTGNGAARAFEFPRIPSGEGDGGAVELLLDPSGEDADHALVPLGVEQHQA